MSKLREEACPCGRGQRYEACCGRFHQGAEPEQPRDLMAARYSAFVLGDAAFLHRTLHPQHDDHAAGVAGVTKALRAQAKSVRYQSLRIRDEAGADLPVGGEGEVWVRGPNVMAGYLDDEAATRAVFDGGWLRTGDLGRVDAWGRLVLVDRLKDLIIRGGANVYPSEVEDALSLHPGVLQVAVIGRPDSYYGEAVVAVIVPRGETPSAAELDEHARAHLAKNKVPSEYVFTDQLPLGPSGKVLKRALRETYGAG